MAKKTLETFTVSANLTAQVTVEIQAADFYEAVDKAKELTITDFIESTSGAFDDCDIVGFSYIGSGDFQKGFKLK
jgi:hypothetical protein